MPCIVASMAKKTKTPAAKTAKPDTDALAERRKLDDVIRQLEDHQAQRAVARATRWARLLDQLETLLDRADDLFTHGVPVDSDYVKQWHAEIHVQMDAEMDVGEPGGWRPTLGDVRKMSSDAETYFLAETLQRAENGLPMVGDPYSFGDCQWFADVRLRLEGKAPLRPELSAGEAIAKVMWWVRKLFEVDLARAKLGAGSRSPVGVEIQVLRVLLASTIALDGDAIATKIGSNRKTVSAKTVWEAVSRLRVECRYEIGRNGAGYKLTDGDRDLARNHGVAVEVVEGES